MKFCPKCKKLVPNNEKECFNCGFPMDRNEKCEFCGMTNDFESDYCSGCGAPINYEEIEEKQESFDFYFVEKQNQAEPERVVEKDDIDNKEHDLSSKEPESRWMEAALYSITVCFILFLIKPFRDAFSGFLFNFDGLAFVAAMLIGMILIWFVIAIVIWIIIKIFQS